MEEAKRKGGEDGPAGERSDERSSLYKETIEKK